MNWLEQLLIQNGLVLAFFVVGILLWVSYFISFRLTRGRIPGAAIAILLGLLLAGFGGKKGIADWPVLSGMALMGGAMLRDFSIVATAMGARFSEIRKSGRAGILALITGVFTSFLLGGLTGMLFGYADAKSFATLGAGACTFIVGPVTGYALGAGSDVVAISIATGVIKSIVVTMGTPLVARRIGLNNPHLAMVYGGIMGTTSGVAGGLAATCPELIPYGALTATFYTGLGCLLCPSVLYLLVTVFLP